nr:hypothetical protein [Angustibacter aerolatus]
MRIDFTPSPRPTLGVEWELALVDRETRDLALGPQVQREPATGQGPQGACCSTRSRS